jgi:hypothetical protein
MVKNRIAWTDDIVWRRIGDEIAAIRDDGLSVNLMNKTAAHIWEMCNGENGADEIVASLCERFDVSAEEARADVIDVIRKMEEIGIVKHVEEVTSL